MGFKRFAQDIRHLSSFVDWVLILVLVIVVIICLWSIGQAIVGGGQCIPRDAQVVSISPMGHVYYEYHDEFLGTYNKERCDE